MTNIDPNRSTAPLRQAAPAPGQTRPLEQAPKAGGDALNISVDARVRLNDEKKPEIVLDGVKVDPGAVGAQVERNMRGRRAGARQAVTQQVLQEIARQVAAALAPVLTQKLTEALVQENLPPGVAADLTAKAVPEITKVIADQLAQQVNVTTTTRLGR